jgi:hypothetical protein
MRRVYLDCAGNSSTGIRGAALQIDNGNHDAGMFSDVKLQPIATGNANCTTGLRPGGTGISVNGINFFSGVVMTQNFGVTQFEIASGTLVVVNGTIWTDYLAGCANTAIGVQLGGDLHAMSVNLNGTQYGIVNAYVGSSSIGTVFMNNIGGDCIIAQKGVTKISSLISNINGSVSCGRYAVDEPGPDAALVWIDTAHVFRINGGAVPYFHNAQPSANLPGHLYIGHLFGGDLTAGINPYAGFSVAPGAEHMVSQINAVIGTRCTGLGTGGTCGLAPGSSLTSGVINLYAGTGAAATGEVSVNFTFPPISIRTCTLQNYFGAWTPTFSVDQITVFETGAIWKNATALVNTQDYHIIYQCSAI